MLVAISVLLRQLGAGDAAKGLIILTGIIFLAVMAITYLPAIIGGI